jgi:site-specific DNA-methyltransferase (adenine-specific)
MWVYGSGFPKSLDVSKAIDKAAGVKFDAVPASGVGFMNAEGSGGYNVTKSQLVRNGESTEADKQWEGWGTALKPAFEPIILARKPLPTTVAANVLAHGTGGLNIDGCRVGTEGGTRRDGKASQPNDAGWENMRGHGIAELNAGRWPANFIHDGSEEVLALFPETGPTGGSVLRSSSRQSEYGMSNCEREVYLDSGSAARFFYCAKASRDDRDEGLPMDQHSSHPTVKPTDLMRYLCRLITPPNGIVLDPFTGSGSTGKAAIAEGFRFIGIERESEYIEIARARISAEADKPRQLSLF